MKQREFFLVDNPNRDAAIYGRFMESTTYWHVYETENGFTCEDQLSLRNDTRIGSHPIDNNFTSHQAVYIREYSTPRAFYVYLKNRCALKRWIRENKP